MPRLSVNPVHLGCGATVLIEPAIAPAQIEWYEAYAQRRSGDGAEGRLVSQHTFYESWPTEEVHPNGAEIVLCLSGGLTVIQRRKDGKRERTMLMPGEYAINEAGVWHTVDIEPGGEATCLFITAGQGTEHRLRDDQVQFAASPD